MHHLSNGHASSSVGCRLILRAWRGRRRVVRVVPPRQVMKLCRDLSRTGRTVIATIHQPRYDIYKMFDAQLFLARGHVVYIGAPDSATQAFEMATQSKLALYENPADFILDTMKVRGAHCCPNRLPIFIVTY